MIFSESDISLFSYYCSILIFLCFIDSDNVEDNEQGLVPYDFGGDSKIFIFDRYIKTL
jgi:hypothetical protein